MACALVPMAAGCHIKGPTTVTKDRLEYNQAIAESWKTQMLLNVVKLRYGDTPVFLDVGSVTAGYASGNSYSAGIGIPLDGTNGALSLGGGGTYSNTPTISYLPMSGERFARSLMMPIPPTAILKVIQSGFPADLVFRLAVQSVNGVDNRSIQSNQVRPADPEFYALLKDLRRIQTSGDFGTRVQHGDKGDQLQMVLRPKPVAALENTRVDVTKLLDLDPTAREFNVVYGTVAANDKEIAILSRSIFEVLTDISSLIEVPQAHVDEMRVMQTPEPDLGPDGPIRPLMRIVSSQEKPTDAFVSAPYRGYWFSIDDKDLQSKQLFSFLLYIFTFVEPGGTAAPPVLTIPVR